MKEKKPGPQSQKAIVKSEGKHVTPGSPPSGIKDKPTVNATPTEKMEVHHHPDIHHEKKPWKEYFLEFLMIFLAVTMGFFAETIRENISEGGKGRELAESLYQEVYKDSIIMQTKISWREEKEGHMEYLKKYIKDSSLTSFPDKFYPSFMWCFIFNASTNFDPNDGILDQLRNSGTLRYFKSIELQNAVSNISTAIYNVRSRNTQEYAFTEQYVRPFLLKYYDFEWEDAFTQNGKLSILQALRQTNFHATKPPQIRNLKEFKRDDSYALIDYYLLIIRSTKQVHYAPYVKANHELLQALRKEYHFKNE